MSVKLSVCLSVCLSHPSTTAAACGEFAAVGSAGGQEISIDLLHRASAAAVNPYLQQCGSQQQMSCCTRLKTDLFHER